MSIDFTDPESVRKLTSNTKDRLVRLQFPKHLASLYAHHSLLSVASGVLRNVLEDTQDTVSKDQQSQYHTIPLEETDLSAWKDVLGLIYPARGSAGKITMYNAGPLLLLANKYDMLYITAQVEDYLMGYDRASATSRFAANLSSDTVMEWLKTTSTCGLDEQAEACMDYIVKENVPITIGELLSIDKEHASNLLEAKEEHYCSLGDKVKRYAERLSSLRRWFPDRICRYECKGCFITWCGQAEFARGRNSFCPNCGQKRNIRAETVMLDDLQL